MEGEVPGRVPGVLPLVRHGDDVVVDHVEPLGVPHALPEQGRSPRPHPVLLEPGGHVVVEVLLAPEHAGERLPHHPCPVRIGPHRRRRDAPVEDVRLLPPLLQHPVVVPEGGRHLRRRRTSEPQPDGAGLAGPDGERDVRRHLGPAPGRVHRGHPAVHHGLVDSVLHVGRGIGLSPESLGVALVLGEEQRRLPLAVEVVVGQRVLGEGDGGVGNHHARPRMLHPLQGRLAAASAPGPGVPEPERGEQMQGRRLGATVHRLDPDQEVLRSRLGVLDEDVEVAVLVEGAGVQQLVLQLVLSARGVGPEQVLVREPALRVLVEVLHVRVGRRAVEVEVVLLHVLAVVALGVGQPEQALLEDGIAAVPERQGEAEPLLAVRDPGEAILTPAVRAEAGLVVGEVGPGVPVLAVVLADGAPLPLAQVRAPLLPVRLAAVALLEPGLLRVGARLVGHVTLPLGHRSCLDCHGVAARRVTLPQRGPSVPRRYEPPALQ